MRVLRYSTTERWQATTRRRLTVSAVRSMTRPLTATTAVSPAVCRCSRQPLCRGRRPTVLTRPPRLPCRRWRARTRRALAAAGQGTPRQPARPPRPRPRWTRRRQRLPSRLSTVCSNATKMPFTGKLTLHRRKTLKWRYKLVIILIVILKY